MSHAYSVKQSGEICKALNELQIRKVLSDVYLEHLETIVHSVFIVRAQSLCQFPKLHHVKNTRCLIWKLSKNHPKTCPF